MVSAVASFLEGFNAGWDTTGKVGAAYKIGKLDDEEERLKAGLQPDETTGKYSIFGMDFDESPDTYQVSEARNMAQAKIYDRWGDADMARGLRSDALSSRASGQTYKAGEQTYNQAERMNPLLVTQAGLQNTGLRNVARASDQTYRQNALLNPIAVDTATATLSGLRTSNDISRQNFETQKATDRLEIQRLVRLRDQVEKTDPLAVQEIEARIKQIESNTTGSDLGNEAAQAAIDQATGMDPLIQRQLRESIARAGELGDAQLLQMNQAITQADLTNPEEVALLQARIASVEAGTDAANEALRQAQLVNPDLAKQLRESIARVELLGVAQLKQVNQAITQADLTNPEDVTLLQARIASVEAGTAATEADTKLKTATFDALVTRAGAESVSAVAASQFAVQALPAKVREAFASADAAEIDAAYKEASFDDRLGKIGVDLDISEQALKQMVAEEPARLQGLLDTNILAAMKIDATKLDLDQQQSVSDVNTAYKDALLKGDFSGVEQVLMPFAVDVYNGSNIEDDDNQAVQNADGSYSIVGPDGVVLGSASEILQSLPMDQKRDILRQAQAYSISAITGDDSGVQELYKTEAWLTYYQAQSDALKKGKSLTKGQWAIQRFEANPLDKLAVAILAGDQAEVVFEQQSDPAFQLQGVGGGGNRPGEPSTPKPIIALGTATLEPVSNHPVLLCGPVLLVPKSGQRQFLQRKNKS